MASNRLTHAIVQVNPATAGVNVECKNASGSYIAGGTTNRKGQVILSLFPNEIGQIAQIWVDNEEAIFAKKNGVFLVQTTAQTS